jgi:hypothetical protein
VCTGARGKWSGEEKILLAALNEPLRNLVVAILVNMWNSMFLRSADPENPSSAFCEAIVPRSMNPTLRIW